MQINRLPQLDSYAFPGIGTLAAGQGTCRAIYQTDDRKAIILVHVSGEQLIYYPTRIGVPAFYPLVETPMPKTLSAVLMDLDGTSVKSEHFWIWVIQEVVIRLTGRTRFRFADDDLPHISGYSVSEHLHYVLQTYCAGVAGATLDRARDVYFQIAHHELQNVLDGKPVVEPSFEPAPHLKEMLLWLRKKGIKIGLVSSGLHEKSMPEIKAAFDTLEMGDPLTFYDVIVTAGFRVTKGHAGTLGELEPKPHPWLYAEALHGLNLPANEVIGLEDSGAGILSLVTAKIPAIGLAGGNIESGGEKPLCSLFCQDLGEAFDAIRKRWG